MSKRFNKYEKTKNKKQKRRGVQEDERWRKERAGTSSCKPGLDRSGRFVQAYMTEYLKEQDTRINKNEKKPGQGKCTEINTIFLISCGVLHYMT